MAAVRGNFKVTKKTTWTPDDAYVEIELGAQYSNSPEDNTYAAATPNGNITMTITNPDAVSKLPVGKFFYVDFTPVDEA